MTPAEATHAEQSAQLVSEIRVLSAQIGRRIQIMEVCGTHTVSIFRSGIRSLMPPSLRLISGPGCPVCVTAQRDIDCAIELALRPNVLIATYGDMLRVPGRRGSLELCRARGARVRVVSSAMTALRLAHENPHHDVVFLGVGFETTAPATAALLLAAEHEGIRNLSVLAAHKLVVPAMAALLRSGDVPLDGFLCPGHVSVIIGARAYAPIVDEYLRPCVVAGFEPLQILRGISHLLLQIAHERARLENVYTAAVTDAGNTTALRLLRDVFVVSDAAWRELGVIPRSGLELAPRFADFDAVKRFSLDRGEDEDNPACICGLVIQGRAEPTECELFGSGCTPLQPVGPCMVSSEGACAAWYKYAIAERTTSC